MWFRRIAWGLLLLSILGLLRPGHISPAQAQAQNLTDLIDINVSAGFGGFFREQHWLPLRVRVRNSGEAIDGRLIVRPETADLVVTNAYSTPLDLPTGSDKTTFLYIMAEAFLPQVVVELLDANGERVAQQVAPITPLNPHDLLHVVVSDTDAASIALNTVRVGAYAAQQVRWTPAQVPVGAPALEAIDTLIFSDADSAQLNTAQRASVRDWVAAGGHLIVTGGTNWQETANAFMDVLPLVPTGSTQVDGLAPLASWVGAGASALAARTSIATGDVQDTGQVLVADDGGLPLLVRRGYGAGTIDYLAADPALEPFRGWQQADTFWYTLLASREMHPAWTLGLNDFSEAAIAVGVLPGVELLPGAVSMLLFIGAYVLLVGPLNYIVLSRINRRGWAWLTIPILIGVFSFLAYNVGFNLRGSEIIVSRINIVESWPENESARLQQLIGVLSPRREVYSLATSDDRFLNVLPRDDDERNIGLINTLDITRSTAEIVQAETFAASGFAVDGGIFANFLAQGNVPAPAISGTLRLIYNYGPDAEQALQGSLRNDSDITLHDAVILARGVAYALPEPLEPGALVTLDADDLTLLDSPPFPNPAPIELSHNLLAGTGARFTTNERLNFGTRNAILGSDLIDRNRLQLDMLDDPVRRATIERRYALLNALVRDQYAALSRSAAYVVGWSDDPLAQDIDMGAVPFRTVDSALYIIALTIDHNPPRGEVVTIRPDQFTWTAPERSSRDNGGPNDLLLLAGEQVVLQLYPEAGAVLTDVQQIDMTIDRNSSRGRDVAVSLWNWQTQAWEPIEPIGQVNYRLDDPARFVGPRNRIDMQLNLDSDFGSARIRGLAISQTGTF